MFYGPFYFQLVFCDQSDYNLKGNKEMGQWWYNTKENHDDIINVHWIQKNEYINKVIVQHVQHSTLDKKY